MKKGKKKVIEGAAAEALDMLGCRIKDLITGLEGIAVSVSFDLYGCLQVALHPGLDKDGKLKDTMWFDSNRLVVLDPNPVMRCPHFESADKGPAEKPYAKN